jgi:hypothetical protein
MMGGVYIYIYLIRRKNYIKYDDDDDDDESKFQI